MVERLILAVPQGCLRFVIVVFPDHTHLLFWNKQLFNDQKKRQNAGNKLRNYRIFKTNIKQEKYTQILDQKQRQILC